MKIPRRFNNNCGNNAISEVHDDVYVQDLCGTILRMYVLNR